MRHRFKEIYEFEFIVEVIATTEKALLVKHDNKDYWIPVSQIDSFSEIWEYNEVGEKGKLIVSKWFAKVSKILKDESVL